MSKSKKPDINQMLLRAHKLGVKKAIETSTRTKTSLVVYKNNKVQSVKPKFKYIRVPVEATAKNRTIKPKLSHKKK